MAAKGFDEYDCLIVLIAVVSDEQLAQQMNANHSEGSFSNSSKLPLTSNPQF